MNSEPREAHKKLRSPVHGSSIGTRRIGEHRQISPVRTELEGPPNGVRTCFDSHQQGCKVDSRAYPKCRTKQTT